MRINSKVSLVVFGLTCFLSLGVTGVVQAQTAKPVVQAPDYNGTYGGSPYTGSGRYTTLYRDNQDDGNSSGCRGEGCGRHPGVDIAVPSGTEVRAPLGGTVVISRCDASWGGLVVLRSSYPLRPWENIYQVFAHLINRPDIGDSVTNTGEYVQQGSVIGRSGGGSRDVCRGNSTGSHLHYQIDKEDGNPEPYFPPRSILNYRDDDASVLNRTYNPMVLLQSGYKWKFAQDNNRELWDLFNLRSWAVSGNALWMDGDFDPYIRRGGLSNCGLSRPCSSSFAAEASDYTKIYLDLYNVCPSSIGKVYFTTIAEPYFDETKTLFYFPGIFGSTVGPFNGYVNTNANTKWSGVITGLRIDPSEQCSLGFDPTYYGEIGLVR